MLRAYRIPLICIGLMSVLIFSPEQSLEGAGGALNSWFSIVLPCLLPFFFLSGLIVIYMPAKRGLSGVWSAYAFVTGMSAMSGYPMSARLCSELYSQKLISRECATRLACMCSVTSPAFFVSAVSTSMLGSPSLSLYLLPAHYASSLIMMTFMQTAKPVYTFASVKVQEHKPHLGSSMLKSATDSFSALLTICAYMVAFGALIGSVGSFIPGFSAVSGVFEMTTGCLFVSELAASIELKLVAISFVCTFAGLCIHAQNHSLFSSCGLKLKGFFLSKLVQGILSGAITLLLLKIIPV